MGDSSLNNKRPFAIGSLPYVVLILAFLGFLDLTYLTILHYKNIIPPCSLAHGCETVLTSKFATIGSIPIALLGALYFLSIFILSGLLLQGKKSFTMGKNQLKTTTILFCFTITSLPVAFFLIFLQAFVLHAFCQYCLTGEALMLLIFITSFFLWKGNK